MAAWAHPSPQVNGLGLGSSLGDTWIFARHSFIPSPRMDFGVGPSRNRPISVFPLLRMGLPSSGPLFGPIVNHHAILFVTGLFDGSGASTENTGVRRLPR